MQQHEFVIEAENRQKLRVVFVTLLLIAVTTSIFFTMFNIFEEVILSSSSWESTKAFFQKDVKDFTPIGLFYLALAGGFFFIPLPVEAFFFTGLTKGNPALLTFFLVIAGSIPGHLVDYFLGKKSGNIIIHLVSKKKIFQLRRKINSYGSYAVLIFNAVPFLPAPLVSFTMGITKYNFYRLFTFLIVGSMIKFGAIYGIYLIIN